MTDLKKHLQKILIVGPTWVGDMVMAQSLFKLLKITDPTCTIDVLAPKATFALLERMKEVRRAIALPLTHGKFGLLTRYKLGRTLINEHYDRAIVLPNSWKSALVLFFAKIPRRTGFHGEMRYGLLNDRRILDKTKYPLMIERFMSLGLAPNEKLPTPYPYPHLQAKPITRPEKVRHGKIIALCPGARYGEAKRWPSAYFAQVALKQIEKGFEVWLFGSKEDAAFTQEIQALTENKCLDLAGKTSMGEAIDLMALVDCVVTNDSGLMHIAAALNKPLIALYGSSSPDFTPPLTDKAHILSLHLPCSPCFKRVCPLGHLKCLRGLKKEYVINELEAMLNE